MDLKELLELAITNGSSDLHLTHNTPPVLRIDGKMIRTDYPALTAEELKQCVYSFLTDAQREKFERDFELDFSLELEGTDRFRVNIHYQKGAVEAVLRRIPKDIPDFTTLGLPSVLSELSQKPNGLILVTGPTGSGKTTTLASMIDLINQQRACHMILIEDPIEYVHQNKRAIIRQREVHSDTKSFTEALRRSLRQDPDVIIVGEMRDLETISTALTAAETGHLVMGTLHTPDAAQTIERIIDVFPPEQQHQIRLQLSVSLQAVVSQKLLPRADGRGRVLATEVLVANAAVRNLIREKSLEQIPTIMQTGLNYGMHTMDLSLKEHYLAGRITYEEAITHVKNVEEFKQLL